MSGRNGFLRSRNRKGSDLIRAFFTPIPYLVQAWDKMTMVESCIWILYPHCEAMILKIYLIASLALVFLFVGCAEPVLKATPTPTPSVADIVKRTTPAVVQIVTPKSSGTGFFVRSDGVILTAGHLVEDVRTVDVIASDGRKWEGQVICRTPRRDLALVYVDDVNIPAVVLGDVEGLAPGDSVIKMGYAAGLPGSASVSSGIVSSIRADADTATVLVQTDAPLNPGDSGGAVARSRWLCCGY